jgi:two-component sensor histidine kinase
MVRRVVNLPAVRAARVRLDALALAHPELLNDENRERLAAALADMDGTDGDEEEAEEEDPDAVGER